MRAERDLERRDQSEVQRCRELRGRVGSEVVAHRSVARVAEGEPALQVRTRLALAAFARAGRKVARVDAVWQAEAGRRRLEHPPGLRVPGAVVRREHPVAVAARRRDKTRRDDRHARAGTYLDVLAQTPLTLVCVRGDVLGDEDRLCSTLPDHPDRFANDVAATHDESSAQTPEGAIQVVQRSAEQQCAPV